MMVRRTMSQARLWIEQVRKYGKTRKAASETIRICKDRRVLAEYLREREKEVIDIMITLFDQEYVMEQYGKTQKKEGREEGKIIEYISIRKEDGWKKKEILTKLVDRFGMNKSEAKRYYKEVCG